MLAPNPSQHLESGGFCEVARHRRLGRLAACTAGLCSGGYRCREEAMREYLAWEINLMNELAADDDHRFRVVA